jgi:hypothetical protein
MALVQRSAPVLLLIAAALAAAPAGAKEEAKRYGIRGVVTAYDEARNVFKVDVKSNEAPSFGGSTAGGKAPSDVEIGKEMEFAVKPEGTVLTRTVIKSTKGTGLDLSGTAEGFKKATELIPKDRPVVLSIEKNAAGTPPYKIQTVFIPLSDEEIQRRIREFTEGTDSNDETPTAQ